MLRAAPARLLRGSGLTDPAVRTPSRWVRAAGLAVLTALTLAGCDGESADVVEIRFWAMGREGEVVEDLMPEFEAENPGVRVSVQQIPWTAAHEKLLTAFVGESTPDVSQLGNTWVPEFVALGALEPLDRWLEAEGGPEPSSFFPGILATNVLGDSVYGVPWYVDTRVFFYREDLLADVGYDQFPTTWEGRWSRCGSGWDRGSTRSSCPRTSGRPR